MSPPRKTAIRITMISLCRPLPVPPGAISPSIMADSHTPPPRLEKLSSEALAAPSAVPVAATPNSVLPGTPKRVSVPSVWAPTAGATVPVCAP
jgi:hypothetical protein